MAATKKKKFYVYVVRDGVTPLYVGKGCGSRHKVSARKHGGRSSIIEYCDCETEAFKRERHWIAELQPENNLCPGGNGKRAVPRGKYELPANLVGRLTPKEWRKTVKEQESFEREIAARGSQEYVAQLLLKKLDLSNCKEWGLSKIDMSRLWQVAHG